MDQPATNGDKTMNRKNLSKLKTAVEKREPKILKQDAAAPNGILLFINKTIFPLLLMLFTPNMVIMLWYTASKLDGNISQFFRLLFKDSLLKGLMSMWGEVNIGTPFALSVIFGYCLWGIITLKILPGKTVKGSITPKGNTPTYVDNGFLYFWVSLAALCGCEVILNKYGHTVTILYDNFGDVIATMNFFSLVFCFLLYIKGLTFPSSSDSGSSGNIIFDYYWGMELYPKVFGIDIKQFTNCRFGMMSWALLVAIFSMKNYQLYGWTDSNVVSTSLQLIYIAKFFWWEAGYLKTIDIMLDRAGYYICWGCLVFVPGFYTAVSLYLVNHPVHLGPLTATGIFVAGTISILINYLADEQKQQVRAAKGNCVVWGKKANIIIANYTLESGEKKQGILLVSGWWGLSRHFHYIPEILLAFCWTVPALFSNIMPYFYVIYLTILLTHRSYRDDDKCSKKYGKSWKEYCRKVPNRIIPYLF